MIVVLYNLMTVQGTTQKQKQNYDVPATNFRKFFNSGLCRCKQ